MGTLDHINERKMVFGMSAIVTGAASGLGRAAAAKLASRGAGVVIFDLPKSEGDSVAKSMGDNVHFFPGDVTSPDDAAAAAQLAVDKFGHLQALVNCAGIGVARRIYNARKGQLHSLDEFNRVISINLGGSFNMMSQAVAQMAKNPADACLDLTDPMNAEKEIIQRGVIINTASVAAFDGQIGQAAYSASKGGIVGLTLPAARDLAAVGIRVNTIAPGVYRTPILDGLPKKVQVHLANEVPFPQRLGDPEHFAEFICAIIDNPMLNGETIRLDGAIRMSP